MSPSPQSNSSILPIMIIPLLLDKFPYHTIPDGDVMFPHHLYLGLFVVALVVWRVSDDYRHVEPVGVFVGSLISLFSFISLWGTSYPVTGAIGTLLGLTVASLSLFTRRVWTSEAKSSSAEDDGFADSSADESDEGNVSYGRRMRLLVALGLLMAWDDALEHAFGLPTPLDLLWKITEAAHWLP